MSSKEPQKGAADLQVISEYLTEDEVTNGGVHLQYLAVEEEPLITNTYVAATPDYVRMPISLQLLDNLSNLANAYAESSPVHNQMAAVRQEIGSIMNKYCQKSLDENNIYLDMYYYYDAPAANKIVNWYGVILKIHQIILQSGLQPMLHELAQNSSSQVYIDPATVKESASAVTSISESSDGVAAESLVQGSASEQSTEPKQPEHPKSLPPWLDIIVYWQHTKADQPISATWNIKSSDPELAGAYIQLELALFTLNTHGSHDQYFEALVLRSVYKALEKAGKSTVGAVAWDTLTEKLGDLVKLDKRSLHLVNLYNQVLAHRVDEKKSHEYMKTMTSTDIATVKSALKSIEEDILHLILAQDKRSLKHIERVLVAALGHEDVSVAEDCTRLLNVTYDGNHWQLHEPFQPVIAYIGEPFDVKVSISGVDIDPQQVVLLVRSPPRVLTNRISSLTRHKVKVIPETNQLTATLPSFFRCGYFDWRFAIVNEDGRYVPLYECFPGKISVASSQGRFIVHPKQLEEHIHQVFVVSEGAGMETVQYTEEIPLPAGQAQTPAQAQAGGPAQAAPSTVPPPSMVKVSERQVVKRGTFAQVVASLEAYKAAGITTLILTGALERPDDVPPSLTSDRSMPKQSLGGQDGLRNLVDKARLLDIKVMLEADLDICKHSHRKYNQLLCHTLTPYNSQNLQVNFRKVEAWDMMAQELGYLVRQFSLKGFALANAHLYPYMLERNMKELRRLDTDGQPHYTPYEILIGEYVVAPNSAQDILAKGYWGTSRSYPNPFFVKITRELWGKFPNFTFYGEYSHTYNRQLETAKSGIIPFDYSIYNAIAKSGKAKDYYQILENWKRYPKGLIPISPISSTEIGFPLANWPTWMAQILVELNQCLPVIPSTLGGEFRGLKRLPDTSDMSSLPGTPNADINTSVEYQNLRVLNEKRSVLRKNQPILSKMNNVIPIRGLNKHGVSEQVFAFCRIFNNVVGVFAINIGATAHVFHMDLSPVQSVYSGDQGTEIYEVMDVLNPSTPAKPMHYLTQDDLVNWKYPVNLKPGEFLYWEIAPQQTVSSRKLLFSDSITRLMSILREDVDPSHNFVFQLLSKGFTNITEFGNSLEKILAELPVTSDRDTLPADLHKIYYHMTQQDQEKETKLLAFLRTMVRLSKNPSLRDTCKRILTSNQIGPIVFVCPELGKWSTAGGLGVMVDELTQDLADLGCDIHVISPYYNRNRRGEHGYLAADGIHWVQNIHTWVGAERVEVGIHEGWINGVHVLFLHNIHYFPHIYPTGSPQYQLKVIVLMAKASLETLCRMKLIPAVIVTNDWFTGLVAAYAKRANSFDTTFHGTSFVHLIHNLGDGYQGLIYPDRTDLTMNQIHHLDNDVLVDPYWSRVIINPSRAALLCSDNWATVSPSYKTDLLSSSTLASLLKPFPHPFAVSNGIRKNKRLETLAKVASNHEEAKRKLQKQYFGWEDPTVPVFAFVGRITEQKGVHLIVDAAAELIAKHKNKIMILVGGPADRSEPYAKYCAERLDILRAQFPGNFWADPGAFFTNGALVNYGADYGLMPSLFEPGGVVQHEFFVAGTPVIAFKTGGLKDTVHEYLADSRTGNGYTFEAHTRGDFFWAVDRAVGLYHLEDHYAQLRKNAFASVITTREVAWGWLKEICRLRRRISAREDAVKEYETAILAELGMADLVSPPSGSSGAANLKLLLSPTPS
eukprot:Phypoly_transcript_00294.p1 GENE.Phypoly_transcript_00294~~Phypoly_transcript_00294.p1  ORF type:complete len:1701 (-),score=242.89 Phypoly_transcript_00294:112-5214(-)